MRSRYTDLAIESEGFSRAPEQPGVRVTKDELEDISITRVDILDAQGAEIIGKPIGTYVTLECPAFRRRDIYTRERAANALAKTLGEMPFIQRGGTTLIVGLGNRAVTADALGPMVVDQTLVTRHMQGALPDELSRNLGVICAIAPGVLGTTGCETAEVVKSLVESIKPGVVIAVDSLAARDSRRICRTIQIADTGIQPGSGVGNHRRALSQETLGVPVVALGIPMVVYAATIARDAMESMAPDEDHEGALNMILEELMAGDMGELVVTPREIDEMVAEAADIVSYALNCALSPNMSREDIRVLMP